MSRKQAAWNAESYHVVSRPHESWAERVLARVPAGGVDSALDAGCGTGKITRELLERLPEATVTALDYSSDMLAVAERELSPEFGDRVRFVQADLSQLTPETIGGPIDLVFSTATFHWVADHDDLFRRLYAVLNPGGTLIAQCGGGPNLARFRERTFALHRETEFAPYFAEWHEPWNFTDAEVT
ncbi:MAG: methyltransferase domain-containing protein, partial [Chloroflexota bacterium]|nr:methyltransferase domain-containing protein [Chloroflexota bacterium]